MKSFLKNHNYSITDIDAGHYFIYSILTVLFFFSGAASLVYEVIWMRNFSLFFGSDIYSSSITLAAFMGGLALGGYFASCYVDKIRHHIAWYGLLEIIIGIYALFFGELLGLFDPFLTLVYRSLFESSPFFYQFIRAAIAFILLIIPTAMMGATLPIILKTVTRQSDKFGIAAGHFYSINTFGALFGVFSSGFILIPTLGLHSTNFMTVVANICIGGICLLLFLIGRFKRIPPIDSLLNQALDVTDYSGIDKKINAAELKRKKAIFFGIGISGLGALALEVIWTRILVRSFSGTVYSFSLMLISFLFGIALGSKLIARHIHSSEKALGILAKTEVAIALSITALSCLSFLIPGLFGVTVWGITGLSQNLFGFASVLGSLFISVIFILPSTILLGIAFPAALKAYNRDFISTGKNSGHIIFINTIGSVIGALLGGFVLIPMVGSKNSLLVISAVFLLNGLYIQQSISNNLRSVLRKFVFPGLSYIILILIAVLIPEQIVLNYNLQKSTRPDVVFRSEGKSGLVEVIKGSNNVTILSIDGNIEADTSLKQLRHFVLKAHLPLMISSSDSKEVLIIGLGLGITASSVLKHKDVKRVDVVELLPSVIKAQRYLRGVNEDVLSDRRIKLYIDDGRNFLKFTQNKYDLITADPIHPRICGVGILYTKEYYSLIFARLKDNGIVLQWMPLYSISERSFKVAVRTMFEVFPNTSIWYVPGHVLLLASKKDKPVFDYEILRTEFMDRAIISNLKAVGIDNILDLLRLQIMPPERVRVFLNRNLSERVILNTEDSLYLEYKTPFEFLATPEKNLNALLPYCRNDDNLVVNASPEFLKKLSAAQTAYRDSILIIERNKK